MPPSAAAAVDLVAALLLVIQEKIVDRRGVGLAVTNQATMTVSVGRGTFGELTR